MIKIETRFKNADSAYKYFYKMINKYGIPFGDTKALFNIGFYLDFPLEVDITDKKRQWNKEYASAEWKWYLSGDPSVEKLGEIYGKIPPIWDKMADSQRRCRSNYGWQWERNFQLDHIIAKLRTLKDTRHAAISIYDGKEISTYAKDTPCTYAIQFTILQGKLDMAVLMRSNDLWYGFCNDQYCFAMLHKMVAERLSIGMGDYYHFAHNLHLYNNKLK